MSYSQIDINQSKIATEDNDTIKRSALLYPIAKSFLEKHHAYDDIIRTYDAAMDDIPEIMRTEKVIDENFVVENNTFRFKLWFDNIRIFEPDTPEAKEYSSIGYFPFPNQASASRGTYSAVYVSDCHYMIELYQKNSITGMIDGENRLEICHEIIPNSYNFNFPIPLYSKYCSLNKYDQSTLAKIGEEGKELAGFFIIEFFYRNLLPIDRKPFNAPLVQKNLYDEQLSRTEVLYTKGYDYEDSYYIIASMLQEKKQKTGRAGNVLSPPDFVFSLQMNESTMNSISTNDGKRSKKLINTVPIRYLFYAFGCTSDLEILKYICPQMDNFGLLHTIRNACISGYKHREACELANIKLKANPEYIVFDEPLDKTLALYIIGCIILKQETKQKLLDISKKSVELYKKNVAVHVQNILDKTFMPGIGNFVDIDRDRAVCTEIGQIIRNLYMIGYDLETSHDKTSMVNKRIRSGQQIEHEFKAFHGVRLREIKLELHKIFSMNNNVRDIQQKLMQQLPLVINVVGKNMTVSLLNSFKQTSKEQSKLRTNLITLKNISFIDTMLREIVKSPSTKKKGSEVSWEHRAVHPSEYLLICPCMSPEAGANTGRYKSPTIYTFITLQKSPKIVVDFITKQKSYIRDIYDEFGRVIEDVNDLYIIKINGSVSGYVKKYDDVDNLYKDLMKARTTQEINRETSIILNHSLGTLSIWTDTGRLMTPLVNVQNCFDIKLKYNNDKIESDVKLKPEFEKWLINCTNEIEQYDFGLDNGFIEYFCAEMLINNVVVAPTIDEFYKKPYIYSHVALPQHIYTSVSGNVPGINLNNGNRGLLITNHVKQMIGPTVRTPQLKYKDEQHILISPQIPLSRPCSYDFKHVQEYPYGQNIIVAFMYYKYNQEDSIVVNKASVESGMLQIDTLVTKVSDIVRDEEFKLPENIILAGNPDSYRKLDPITCLPKRVSEHFFQYDALIGKIIKTQNGDRDISVLNNQPDGRYLNSPNSRVLRCIVKNRIHEEDHNTKICMFGQFQTPIVSDKTNFETAQKGTIGRIIDASEMPYTSSGIRPDVIFNPPSIFKRVTYSQLYLTYLNKLAALMGCPIDCTPSHTQRNTEDLCELMKKLGLHESGEEIMYDPDTGKQIPATIFVGINVLGRQPHIVERKLNIRCHGSRNAITLQPLKGRKRNGGISIDRMCNDCMLACGANLLNRDAHLKRGSEMLVGVCNRCHGMKTYYHETTKSWCCSGCGYHSDFELKYMPPASVLINHVFNALHISLDYYPEGDKNDTIKKYLRRYE